MTYNYPVTKGVLPLDEFMTSVPILHPLRGAIPFSPYDYQREFAHTVENERLVAAVVARQMGITTLLSAWALWAAASKPNYRIALISPYHINNVEMLGRIRYMFEHGHVAIPHVRVLTKTRIEFANGSAIEARGQNPFLDDESWSHVLFNDAAWIHQMGSIWTTVMPHITRGTKVLVQSAANTTSDVFYNILKGALDTTDEHGNVMPNGLGRNGMKGLILNWRAHPERDEAWAEPYRKHLTELQWRQEFECEFRDE